MSEPNSFILRWRDLYAILQPDRDHTGTANPEVLILGSLPVIFHLPSVYPSHLGPGVPPTDQQTSPRAFLTLISKVPQELWLAQGFHLSSHLQLEFTTQRRQASLSPLECPSCWGTACVFQFWLLAWTLNLGRVLLRLLARPTGWNPRLNSCDSWLWALGFHHCLVSPSLGPSNGLEVFALGCDRSCCFLSCNLMWERQLLGRLCVCLSSFHGLT